LLKEFYNIGTPKRNKSLLITKRHKSKSQPFKNELPGGNKFGIHAEKFTKRRMDFLHGISSR
jgi:hypothetical protein